MGTSEPAQDLGGPGAAWIELHALIEAKQNSYGARNIGEAVGIPAWSHPTAGDGVGQGVKAGPWGQPDYVLRAALNLQKSINTLTSPGPRAISSLTSLSTKDQRAEEGVGPLTFWTCEMLAASLFCDLVYPGGHGCWTGVRRALLECYAPISGCVPCISVNIVPPKLGAQLCLHHGLWDVTLKQVNTGPGREPCWFSTAEKVLLS